MKTPDEADSTEPVLVISLAASERLTDAHACPWTRVEPCVTGLVASFQTLDEQAQPVRLGVETVGRAFYSIEDTIFAKYSERYSLRRPWEHVGPSARRRPSWTVAATIVYKSLGGKGLIYAYSLLVVRLGA